MRAHRGRRRRRVARSEFELPPDSPPTRNENAAADAAEEARLRDEPRAAEQRSRRLAAELPRHLNNALAIVHSVMRRTARAATSVEEYVMQLESRLGAIARGQAMAMRTLPFGTVELDELLAEELLAHSVHEDEQVSLSGPRVTLPLTTAAPLGLAFHELTLNAVTHGALSTEAGRVEIAWRLETNGSDANRLVLQWRERSGPPPPAERGRGFGMEMLQRTLPYELGSQTRLAFEPTGFACTLEVPILEPTPLA